VRPWLLAATLVALAAPGGADEPPPEALLAELPFLEHPEPRRIVVDLAPEGAARPLRFMLDTGASHAIATPLAARELGIQVRRHKRDPYRRKTRLGRDVQIYVDVSSSDTGSRTGWEYALLGGEFLAEYVLELDFAARRVRLLDPKRYQVPERATGLGQWVSGLSMHGNRPGLELVLNGVPTRLLIDTGAPIPMVLSGEVAGKAAVPPSGTGSFESLSVLGPMLSEIRMVDELRVGPSTFAGFATVVNPHGWYNIGASGDSVIGYELLAMFRVRIDYPRRRLWLELRPDARSTFMGHEYQGLDDLLGKLDLHDEAPPPEPAS
jgi:predicted aspartyl protease